MTQLGKKQGKGKGGPKTPEGKARALANLKPFREKRDQHGVTVINPGQPEVQAVSQQIKDLLQVITSHTYDLRTRLPWSWRR